MVYATMNSDVNFLGERWFSVPLRRDARGTYLKGAAIAERPEATGDFQAAPRDAATTRVARAVVRPGNMAPE